MPGDITIDKNSDLSQVQSEPVMRFQFQHRPHSNFVSKPTTAFSV